MEDWIPVGEKNPDTEGEWIVTFETKSGARISGTAYFEHGEWMSYGGFSDLKIVAWRPWPEPFEGNKHETPLFD